MRRYLVVWTLGRMAVWTMACGYTLQIWTVRLAGDADLELGRKAIEEARTNRRLLLEALR